MQAALLHDSINVTADDVTLDTLTADVCRHLAVNHPLASLLFVSPSASLRRPAVLFDYVMRVLANAASMYGFGYLTWYHNSPTPPPQLSTSPYLPVPILSPFAPQFGYGVVGRGSLLVDNAITTLLLTVGVTALQGLVIQLLASRGRRPLTHPQLVGRPLSYMTAWRESGMGWRVLCMWTQYSVLSVLACLLLCCGLCGVVGGGLNECEVEASTAVWLKVVWCVPYTTLLYPLVSTNVQNLSDTRLERYIETVREKQATGEKQTTVPVLV